MTVAAVLPHRDAVWALLQTETRISWFEAEVPSTPPVDAAKRVRLYGVFWPSAGKPEAPKLCGDTTDLDWPFGVTVYGGTAEACLLARDFVCAVLVDVTPVVTGRVVRRIRMDYSAPLPQRSDVPQPPRFGLPLLFTLATVPA